MTTKEQYEEEDDELIPTFTKSSYIFSDSKIQWTMLNQDLKPMSNYEDKESK